MNMTFINLRGERASTDGHSWWLGEADADETTRKANALQPASTLFATDGLDALAMSRVRKVFISGLRKTAPAIQPDNEGERAIFRTAWDNAVAFDSEHYVLKSGVPVFDGKLQVVGMADAIFTGGATYCYLPASWRYSGAMNAVVRLLHHGFPFSAEEDPFGFYSQKDLSCALLALVYRHETDWWIEHSKDIPF